MFNIPKCTEDRISVRLRVRLTSRELAGSELRASAPSDSALLARVKNGDPGALEELYERHSRAVYTAALRILRESSAAEDVAQEVWLHLWRKPVSFDDARGRFAGWLAVVSRNRAIDHLRRKLPSESLDGYPLPSSCSVSRDAEANLMMNKLRLLAEELPKTQQQALEMAFFGGLTHAEIAKQTNLPLGTIKTRIRTALQRMGEAFRKQELRLRLATIQRTAEQSEAGG